MRLSLAIYPFAIALCLQHGIAAGDLREKTNPIVSVSAQGWTLKPGPPSNTSSHPTTVVVNPKGGEFNIGTTAYPDFLAATLWIVEVKELKARFLIIRVPPAASAPVGMPLLYLSQDDKPLLAGLIRQRFEFHANAADKPGSDPRIRWDGEHRLRDVLFEDSDGDGVPELVEKDFSQAAGTVTYFRFTEEKTFVPLCKETWKLGTNGYERVSRIKAENAKR
jgi:hypothetical protein